MLAIVAAYVVMARRFPLLWHPLSIVAAVGIVSIAVSVLGELLFNRGWAGVPTMLAPIRHRRLRLGCDYRGGRPDRTPDVRLVDQATSVTSSQLMAGCAP